MKPEELITALFEGKKVRDKCWNEGFYIELNFEGKCFIDENSMLWADYSNCIKKIIETPDNWEIFEDVCDKCGRRI